MATAAMPAGHCLGALETCVMLWKVEIYNFLIHVGCTFPRRKCLGAPALSKMKHTALNCCSMHEFLIITGASLSEEGVAYM